MLKKYMTILLMGATTYAHSSDLKETQLCTHAASSADTTVACAKDRLLGLVPDYERQDMKKSLELLSSQDAERICFYVKLFLPRIAIYHNLIVPALAEIPAEKLAVISTHANTLFPEKIWGQTFCHIVDMLQDLEIEKIKAVAPYFNQITNGNEHQTVRDTILLILQNLSVDELHKLNKDSIEEIKKRVSPPSYSTQIQPRVYSNSTDYPTLDPLGMVIYSLLTAQQRTQDMKGKIKAAFLKRAGSEDFFSTPKPSFTQDDFTFDLVHNMEERLLGAWPTHYKNPHLSTISFGFFNDSIGEWDSRPYFMVEWTPGADQEGNARIKRMHVAVGAPQSSPFQSP